MFNKIMNIVPDRTIRTCSQITYIVRAIRGWIKAMPSLSCHETQVFAIGVRRCWCRCCCMFTCLVPVCSWGTLWGYFMARACNNKAVVQLMLPYTSRADALYTINSIIVELYHDAINRALSVYYSWFNQRFRCPQCWLLFSSSLFWMVWTGADSNT